MSQPAPQRVRLLHYDPRWPQEFQQTRSSLLFAGEGWVQAVEHIGSTAVSGLIARPTVDVVVGIADPKDLEPAASRVEGLSFRRCQLPHWIEKDADDASRAPLAVLEKPRHGEPTHRAFLTQIDSPLWQRLLAVRDWLRNQPDSAVDFEASKVQCWKECEGDPAAYAEAKRTLFAELKEQIETSGDEG